ncbi:MULTISPECIES: alcohol dehydrogenase catalytic domain-containing protein [unclassified Acidisoma]|jgi:L-iditol 2-dehydrogenase|uniref:alcohol dehydrogenase catalytic domain-containing protein n=1 Tax=unclassified Acidisoma TaxID=2634065 RepID=UPI00131C276E|nr:MULTISPECIES: alcohol dehydrogenase catalytic domain-containing protein [unclassified Acidisoma]
MRRNSETIPKTMRALILKRREHFEFAERMVPVPKAGEVLLKIGAVGICGSDKHFYFDGRCGSEIVTSPVVLGHEFGGRIVAVGDGVDAQRLDDRVAVEPLMPTPGDPFVLEGNYNICPTQKFFGVPGTDGAMQQYLCVPSQNAFKIPDSVSDNAAAMVETISVALAGAEKGAIHLGSRVLVTGGGPVGQFAVQVARAAGATEIVVVEPHTGRRQLAGTFGARTTSNLADVDEQFDVLMECSGVESVRHDGCLKVRSGGRAVLIGVGAQVASLPMSAIIEREVTIHGVMRYKFTWPTVIAAIKNGQIDADSLVSRVLPLSDALDGWLKPLPDEIKTMICMNP